MVDTIFPSRCASCGEIADDSLYPNLCGDCGRRIKLVDDPKCTTCGYPFFGETESHSACPHCENLNAVFQRGWTISLFQGPLRDLIYSLKYEKGLWALRDLAELVKKAPGLKDFLQDSDLVPVPLHSRKLRERGYNQSLLIAQEISKSLGLPKPQSLLARVVDTPSQTQFNRRERSRNLRNAFSLIPKSAIEPGRRYVLVDDVFTTGSTLNACAGALIKGGAKNIDVLTIGHG